MKTLVVMGLAVAMLGVGMPAMAADDTSTAFFALNQVTGEASLEAMTDSQLTSVEGTGDPICVDCTNVARIDQTNVVRQLNLAAVAGLQLNLAGDQSNSARVYQRIQ